APRRRLAPPVGGEQRAAADQPVEIAIAPAHRLVRQQERHRRDGQDHARDQRRRDPLAAPDRGPREQDQRQQRQILPRRESQQVGDRQRDRLRLVASQQR